MLINVSLKAALKSPLLSSSSSTWFSSNWSVFRLLCSNWYTVPESRTRYSLSFEMKEEEHS